VNKNSQNYVPSVREEKAVGAGQTPCLRTNLEPINVYAIVDSIIVAHGVMVSLLVSVHKPATFMFRPKIHLKIYINKCLQSCNVEK